MNSSMLYLLNSDNETNTTMYPNYVMNTSDIACTSSQVANTTINMHNDEPQTEHTLHLISNELTHYRYVIKIYILSILLLSQ